MRLLGICLFVFGLLFLGWWATTRNAERIQAYVTQKAAAVSGGAMHNVDVNVFGRDIELTGLVDTQVEADALVDAATQVEGRRVVRSDFTILPQVSLYKFSASRQAGGVATVTGYMPTATEAKAVAEASGIPSISDLELASGAPKSWTDTVSSALEQIDALETADLEIEGDTLRVTGHASDQATAASVKKALMEIPGITDASVDITAPEVVVPEVTASLPVIDNYTFSATKTVEGIGQFSGYAPSEEARTALSEVVDPSLEDVLELADGSPDGWVDTVMTSYQALGELKTGTLSISGYAIQITGEAPDANTRDQIVEALSNLPGVTTEVDVTLTPVPANMSLQFDRGRGFFVSGMAPESISAASIANDLDVEAVNGSFDSKVATTSPVPVDSAIGTLVDYLPEFENFTLDVDGEDVSLKGETLAGTEIDQINDRLNASGHFATLELTRAEPQFVNGDTRRNPSTGQEEVYSNGAWLPKVQAAEPTLSSCTDSTQSQLESRRILFLTNSSTIDDTSRDIVGTIAEIMKSCFAANDALKVEIGGHTDNVGNVDSNQTLSLERAQSVRQALIDLGVSKDRLTAQGFGESQPLASNDTDEGRSANRRTTLSWTE